MSDERPKINTQGLTAEEAQAARGLMRHLDAPTPTLAEFIRHAELYGTELVYETAEDFLGESELMQLLLELNRIDGKPAPGHRFTKPTKRRRLTTAQQIKAAEYLRAEGAPNSRIATHLGVGVKRVETIFKEARRRAQEAEETLLSDEVGEPVA